MRQYIFSKNINNQGLAGKQFTIFMVSRSDDNYFGFSGNNLNGGGGSNPHLGQMAEIIIYNRSLIDYERNGIESYLSDKYALHNVPVWKATPANLPSAINLKTTSVESLHIYPNPVNGSYLNIELLNTGGNEIFVKIYDLNGTEQMS